MMKRSFLRPDIVLAGAAITLALLAVRQRLSRSRGAALLPEPIHDVAPIDGRKLSDPAWPVLATSTQPTLLEECAVPEREENGTVEVAGTPPEPLETASPPSDGPRPGRLDRLASLDVELLVLVALAIVFALFGPAIIKLVLSVEGIQ